MPVFLLLLGVQLLVFKASSCCMVRSLLYINSCGGNMIYEKLTKMFAFSLCSWTTADAEAAEGFSAYITNMKPIIGKTKKRYWYTNINSAYDFRVYFRICPTENAHTPCLHPPFCGIHRVWLWCRLDCSGWPGPPAP